MALWLLRQNGGEVKLTLTTLKRALTHVPVTCPEAKQLGYVASCKYIIASIGWFATQDLTGLVMEYAEHGTLDNLIHTTDYPLGNDLKYRFITELAQGIKFLHQSMGTDQRLLHRDLKPLNILLDEDFHIKICDFGGSVFSTFTQNWDGNTGRAGDSVASLAYCAPERLRNQRSSSKVDIFSYGVIIWEINTRRRPFHEERSSPVARSHILENVRPRMDYFPDPTDENHSLHQMRHLIVSCWDGSPDTRPSAEKICKFLEGAYPPNKVKAAEEAVNLMKIYPFRVLNSATATVPLLNIIRNNPSSLSQLMNTQPLPTAQIYQRNSHSNSSGHYLQYSTNVHSYGMQSHPQFFEQRQDGNSLPSISQPGSSRSQPLPMQSFQTPRLSATRAATSHHNENSEQPQTITQEQVATTFQFSQPWVPPAQPAASTQNFLSPQTRFSQSTSHQQHNSSNRQPQSMTPQNQNSFFILENTAKSGITSTSSSYDPPSSMRNPNTPTVSSEPVGGTIFGIARQIEAARNRLANTIQSNPLTSGLAAAVPIAAWFRGHNNQERLTYGSGSKTSYSHHPHLLRCGVIGDEKCAKKNLVEVYRRAKHQSNTNDHPYEHVVDLGTNSLNTKCNVVLICASVDNHKSFKNALGKWLRRVSKSNSRDAVKILVMTNTQLYDRQDYRRPLVSEEEYQQMAQDLDIESCEYHVNDRQDALNVFEKAFALAANRSRPNEL
ncbi:uncharacterized protein LOC143471073 isoform X2 [Clavelina lepadiformis]|uniref:uncharacterized protein LOC143471073 isoform X2 n=1 Tax=Clavelina lepadiformis TaxID=159417 RepID=UPI004042FD82